MKKHGTIKQTLAAADEILSPREKIIARGQGGRGKRHPEKSSRSRSARAGLTFPV
eukprot:CAMPEP_0173317924 /NCGR_PEP_ID=MMETSP1143-20121109/27374_1 /TAXON_ID=483371 /ORGANISM="non described non described, Strain CCMP2298" /LENGTH=54 /DNA_ID=CAMNT_0014261117 /DNA_START=22 /DNA_END=182 /DNA_ORIENTATION=+